ncbi:DUF2878 domain-containing protein [Motilimonas eburnea]|uniref:DUF2878 domain-containing protein n=1 Tax=Motilimonas eburnea TaxID=1737488 RepID=UPI001E28C916|nr:DUF2878 domain-containing protein [Motilimonas eburnea]MCE2573131.1 DUF2878 domain-containing protein [Motilimonas eburnea]
MISTKGSWPTHSAPRWLVKHFIWVNALVFQLVWFSSILMQQDSWPITLLLLFGHFYLSPQRRQDVILMFGVTLVGIIMDSSLSALEVFVFADQVLMPVWLIFIWLHFALCLNHSLAWLRRIPLVLVALIGAVAGPASYLAGYRLGAVELSYGSVISGVIIAVLWALALPAFVQFSAKLKLSRQ